MLKILLLFTIIYLLLSGIVNYVVSVYGDEITASWYSEESLKQEGTWKTSHGIMANGELYNENNMTCASRLHPLNSYVRVTNVLTGKSVVVKVTDRIGKRFANTRIDLSKTAFQKLADLNRGVIPVLVNTIHTGGDNGLSE